MKTIDEIQLEGGLIWAGLERMGELKGVRAAWRACLGEKGVAIPNQFLQQSPQLAESYFCERCYCGHEVRLELEAGGNSVPLELLPQVANRTVTATASETGAKLRAVCRCADRVCPDILLTLGDIAIWTLNWSRIARAIAAALELNPAFKEMQIRQTVQVGTWSAEPVPVLLTIQPDSTRFNGVVMELTARLRRRFILLSPTGRHFTAETQEILAHAGAEFFALENIVRITQEGTLMLKGSKAPGILFSAFTPQPRESEEGVARKAFAMIKALDLEETIREAPVITVFRLYCVDGLSADQVARKCRCSKGTVISRLRMIRQRTGTDPEKLRAYSAHFGRIEDDLTDPRARHVHRHSAIEEMEE